MAVLLHSLHICVVFVGTLVVGYLLRPQHRAADSEIDRLRAAAAQGTLIELAQQRALRESAARETPRQPAWLLRSAALCCVLAATVHAAVSPEHFREGLRFGLFFVVLTCLQLGVAAGFLVRPSARLVTLAAVGTGAVVLLWALTRTVALPFGLAEREAIGAADTLASVAEVVAVCCCAAWIRRNANAMYAAPALIGVG